MKFYHPSRGTPYVVTNDTFVSPLGIPCNAPPWGVLTAIDLQQKRVLWEQPFGRIRDLAPVPISWQLGVPNTGGALITASDLIFIGAAADNYLRAYALKTGEELWRVRLPAGGQAGHADDVHHAQWQTIRHHRRWRSRAFGNDTGRLCAGLRAALSTNPLSDCRRKGIGVADGYYFPPITFCRSAATFSESQNARSETILPSAFTL